MALTTRELLAAVARVAALERLDEEERGGLPRGAPPRRPEAGATIEARVVGRTAEGAYVVETGVQRLEVTLPEEVAPGSAVRLRHPGLATIVPAPVGAADTCALSGAGVLIARALMQDASPEPVRPRAPLDVAASSPQSVARDLRASVELSGLFYESHLAAWTEGTRPLEAIRREPQALAATAREASATGPTPGARDADVEVAPQAPAASAGAPERGATARPDEGIPQALLPILRQQLEVLDTRAVLWQGTVWPGQEAALLIAEDEPHPHDRAAADRAGGWRSRLEIDLPAIGRVVATVAIAPDGTASLELRVRPASREPLVAGAAAFAQALGEAGVRVGSLSILADERA